MEVYILDSLNRRVSIVERYESFTWAERFNDLGDFEMVVHSNFDSRSSFVPGVRMTHDETRRVATIETVEDNLDLEGKKILKINGRSIEQITQQRLAMADLTDLETDPKWSLEGFPKDLAEQLFHDICVTGILDSGDIISGIVEGSSLFPADTIPAPSEEIIYEFEPKSLYDAIKTLCDAYDMGFRMVRDPVSAILYFDIYMGVDRTTAQIVLPVVAFSPDLDNLHSTRELTSNALYKSVAYVVSTVGHEIVFADGVDPSVAGFERRVLYVKADDIDDPDPPTASAQMIQRGKEQLSLNRQFRGLDGELDISSQYTYGTDYNLGDLVELRNDDGLTSYMRVTEQIFVSDREGQRRYPTLTTYLFITPGSWDEQGPTVHWDDIGGGVHWDD
jgi:hypothetical protein